MNVMINGNMRRLNLALPSDSPIIYGLSRLIEKQEALYAKTKLADTVINGILKSRSGLADIT